MFLSAVSSVGYPEVGKHKRQIEQISKNPVVSDFLLDLSSYLSPKNVISPSQWISFKELKDRNEALNSHEVQEAIRYEQHKKKRLEQSEKCLKRELDEAKLRQALLEKQLTCLEETHAAATSSEDDMLTLVKSSSNETNKVKKKHKEISSKFSRRLADISNDCSLISCNYENKSNKHCLLSHVDIEPFLFSEDEYSSHLTNYTKRQFQDVPSILENLSNSNCEVNDITDAVLLQDESEEVKEALLGELARAANGYKNRKKRVILAKANLQKSDAIFKFLQAKSSHSKYNVAQDSRHLGALQRAITSLDEQIAYTTTDVLPGLISEGVPIQRNHLLTGNIRKKLIEQQKITQKQKDLIDLLLEQCSRLSVVWMMLQLEKTQVTVLSKKIKSLTSLLTELLESCSSSFQSLQSIQEVDHSNKEPKAVIGSRDFVMLDLQKVLCCKLNVLTLTATSSDQPDKKAVFQTLESAFQAATQLNSKLNALSSFFMNCNKEDFLLLPLSNCTRRFLWDNNDAATASDEIVLTTSQISKGLKLLEDDVAEAKVSVPKLLTKVDKKRAFVDHNSEVAQARNVWLDFVSKATSGT